MAEKLHSTARISPGCPTTFNSGILSSQPEDNAVSATSSENSGRKPATYSSLLPRKTVFFSVNGAWECIWFGFNLHTHVNWNQPVREIYHVHPGEETFTRIRNDAEEAYALLAEESGNVFPLVENLLENILMRGNAESLFELNPRLEAAKNFIAANLRINDFKEVARRFGMSRTKFFQTFRETYGTTPQKYHEKIKFQNVCSLLATTDLSFSEIAKICGFSSLFYLSKRFRALFKTSMRSYRAQSSGKTLL